MVGTTITGSEDLWQWGNVLNEYDLYYKITKKFIEHGIIKDLKMAEYIKCVEEVRKEEKR